MKPEPTKIDFVTVLKIQWERKGTKKKGLRKRTVKSHYWTWYDIRGLNDKEIKEYFK